MTPLTNDAIAVRLTEHLTGALTGKGLRDLQFPDFGGRVAIYEPRGGPGRAPGFTTQTGTTCMEQFRFACPLTMPRASQIGT